MSDHVSVMLAALCQTMSVSNASSFVSDMSVSNASGCVSDLVSV